MSVISCFITISSIPIQHFTLPGWRRCYEIFQFSVWPSVSRNKKKFCYSITFTWNLHNYLAESCLKLLILIYMHILHFVLPNNDINMRNGAAPRCGHFLSKMAVFERVQSLNILRPFWSYVGRLKARTPLIYQPGLISQFMGLEKYP